MPSARVPSNAFQSSLYPLTLCSLQVGLVRDDDVREMSLNVGLVADHAYVGETASQLTFLC